MNFQDISDFMDLVKDPTKAEALLATMVQRQEQIEAAVASVGKASELDGLIKKAEKVVAKSEKRAMELEQELTAKLVEQQIQHDTTMAGVLKQAADARSMAQEASVKMDQAVAMTKDFAAREKALKASEKTMSSESERLASLMAEYEEKVAKLRAVMV